MVSIDAVRRHGSCTPDRTTAWIAAQQGGRISTAQLNAAGLDGGAIGRRVRAGHLHRLPRSVYAVGHAGPVRDGHLFAALLGAGDGTVVARRSACALWGFGPEPATVVELVTERRGRTSWPGVRLRKTRSLPAEDVAEVRGMPVTSVARTLVDLCAVADERRIERTLHEAEILRLLDVTAVEEVLGRSSGRRGAGVLRRLLADAMPPTPHELQRRFARLCVEARIDGPVHEARIGPYTVDFLWPAERLIVETDGRAVHDTRRGFEKDRSRDVELAKLGFHVARFTWRRITSEPAAVAADVAALLAMRRALLGVQDR